MKRSKGKKLAEAFPELIQEWNDKNEFSPWDINSRSHKKAWWKCKQGHEWEAIIHSRTNGKNNCPYCSNQKLCADNSLESTFPKIAKEWHPTKNGSLTPKDVVFGHTKKVWWQCANGHEWFSPPHARTGSRKLGCPKCKKKYSSFEIRVFAELDALYGAKWQYDEFGFEIDVYIPSLKIAVEIDGSYWHKELFEKDAQKNQKIKKNGLMIIRLREEPLLLMEENDLSYKNKDNPLKTIKRLVSRICLLAGLEQNRQYEKRESFLNPKGYEDCISRHYFPKKSVADDEQLIKEWDWSKNGLLKPRNISFRSHRKLWWICENGHSWQAMPSNRRGKTDCPQCALKNRTKINNEELIELLLNNTSRKEICSRHGITNGTLKNKICELKKQGHTPEGLFLSSVKSSTNH